MMKMQPGRVMGLRFCVEIFRALFFTDVVLPSTALAFLPDKHLLFGA